MFDYSLSILKILFPKIDKSYSTRTVERTILEGGRVCIINVFKIKSLHEKSLNYLDYCLTLAFFRGGTSLYLTLSVRLSVIT